MKKMFWMVICILLCAGCVDKNGIPKKILKPEKMQDVMWDVFMAQAWAQQVASKDSSASLPDKIKEFSDYAFEIHHVKEQDFLNSYDWYLQNPMILKPILDSLSARKSNTEENELKKPEKLLRNKKNFEPLKSDVNEQDF